MEYAQVNSLIISDMDKMKISIDTVLVSRIVWSGLFGCSPFFIFVIAIFMRSRFILFLVDYCFQLDLAFNGFINIDWLF